MVTSNKSKKQTNNKGGGIPSTKGTVRVTNTTIRNNAAFKIDDNEAPRPQDRLFLPYNYYNQNTPQYFVGGNVTGLFQRTNFSVVPPFNVDGSGAMGGVFGGVLIPVPNTNVLIGPRFGWEGGDINGNTVAPAASRFTYTTLTNSIFYQEAMVKIPINGLNPLFFGGPASAVQQDVNPASFITASAGVAEVHTEVKGTLGAFTVTDSAYRPGLTFTTGLGVPLGIVMNGVTVDIFAQWRGTLTTATVNIPAPVATASWINGVDFGLELRY